MLELTPGEPINRKHRKDLILVFASSGDNITPPPQALNWVKKVYGSVAEITRNGQVIVYMVHEDVGHLGIFVSGRGAKKEHKEIIGCLEMLDYLSPGLYEMVIEGDLSQPWLDDYQVGFEERSWVTSAKPTTVSRTKRRSPAWHRWRGSTTGCITPWSAPGCAWP